LGHEVDIEEVKSILKENIAGLFEMKLIEIATDVQA
jgi:hypothetical protein